MSAAIGPSYHGGDCGGDPPNEGNWQPLTGCAAGGSKLGRKRTKNLGLKAALKKSNKKILDIEFEKGDRGTYIAVGPNSFNFNSLVGTIISRIPYYYSSWKSIPAEHTCTIYEELQSYYDVNHHLNGPEGRLLRIGLEKYFAHLYRSQKYKYSKKHFEARGGLDHAVTLRESPPEDVPAEEWHQFVDFKTSEAFQKRSTANKACREKQEIIVRHGRKNFAQIRYDNKNVSPIELWKRQRSKQGAFTEKAAAKLYAKMMKMKNDPNNTLDEYEIMGEVLGERRGWTRGVGQRLPQSAFYADGSSSSQGTTYTADDVRRMFAEYTAPYGVRLR